MLIDHRALSKEALEGILESFVQQEGTDYGDEVVVGQAKKCAQVRDQLNDGRAVIVYDPELQTCNIITQQQYQALISA